VSKILLATSEAVPFAKTGGLADVAGTLPIELARLGHEVSVIMPAYRCVHDAGVTIHGTGIEFELPIGNQIISGRFLEGRLPDSDVPIYFVKQDGYFDRAALYSENGRDYRDNCQRFVFFCRAVMEAIRLLELEIDLLHCNDWQTALLPVYLEAEYRHSPGFESLATLITVHNLAYQGVFWHWDMLLTGLDWKYFNWQQLEFYGDLNLLKGGIATADAINTVSPKYAEEIQDSRLGCGLDGVLRNRSESLSGIINGVDYDIWNPVTDDRISQNYDLQSWQAGKAACKQSLQHELGLAADPDALLLGFVGRLVEQKGVSLLVEAMQRWVHHSPVQWVILGSGEPQHEQSLRELAESFPQRVAVRLEFSETLAHRIEAGSDAFLMPSRYEPCGLNQMYSLKYGTLPIVHSTGGLSDTILHASQPHLDAKTANGFSFGSFDTGDLEATLGEVADMYSNRREIWQQLVQTGMTQDWSWKRSAQAYADLYKQTIQKVRQTICA